VEKTRSVTAESPSPKLAVLIPPLITFVAVCGLLLLASVYDQLPVKAPECRLNSTFGVPCPTCGGTRALQALTQGDLGQAFQFNPLVVVGTLTSVIWFALGIRSYYRGTKPAPIAEQNQKLKRTGVVLLVLLVINWFYLLIFLE